MKTTLPPAAMLVRGARVHNLKNIDVDVPLGRIVAVAGVSGSGKSSLALGVLYAEGSRRYLESFAAYTRRRLRQTPPAAVDEALYIPPALALRQRPEAGGLRSTFGTGTELLNTLRLLFSRLASHRCPNGHYLEPTLNVAAEKPLHCPECGETFFGPGAEDLAFNSQGACPSCGGTGVTRAVNRAALVPDESLTIDEGAVAPWRTLMWSLMADICRAMGVRTDVPFRDLTPEEKAIVFDGPAEKKRILYQAKSSNQVTELDFTFYNAVRTVENALSKAKDEKGIKRVERFLIEEPCPACHGTRLSEAARAPRVRGIGLDAATAMTLDALAPWVAGVSASLPEPMRPMAGRIAAAFADTAARLFDLGLSYLSLDRAASTLSTGERQRMQLARAVRNRTTGALYVLDEPSIGLHPLNLGGVSAVMADLVADGNSVVVVDHDVSLLAQADWIIELGPGAGANGGRVIAQGAPETLMTDPASRIGPFLKKEASGALSPALDADAAARLFEKGVIRLATDAIHTVRPLEATLPKGRLIVVTGVSGSGKTTLVLESLVPALEAAIAGAPLPGHVRSVDPAGLKRVCLIDAAPIGANVRSTVATYADVHDRLRALFARTPKARELDLKAGDFSYNTGSLRCPVCDGCGSVSLDIQFLADVDIPCPECHGSRYARKADLITCETSAGELSLPALMALDVDEALAAARCWSAIRGRLDTLRDLGLGYLTLGEATPALSGGEAQRLKLASEIDRSQADTLFVFDEPTIGLNPLDVETLLGVFRRLLAQGATLVVIEHDLTVMRNADYIIDMGPGGGADGGRIVVAGTPAEIAACPESRTGPFLAQRS